MKINALVHELDHPLLSQQGAEMKWVWWLLGVTVYIIARADFHASDLVLIIILYITASLGGRAERKSNKKAQENRDARAQRLADQIVEKFRNEPVDEYYGKEIGQPFVLYLRPFVSDAKITVGNPDKGFFRNLFPTSSAGTPTYVPLETLVLNASTQVGELVALGSTIEIVGAGKINSVEGEWKDYFKMLADRAACIVAVPSLHTSTLWELEWIARNSLFCKTVMIFTELHCGDQESGLFEKSKLVERLQKFGWRMPVRIKPGTMISFNTDGGVLDWIDSPRYKAGHLRQLISNASVVSCYVGQE